MCVVVTIAQLVANGATASINATVTNITGDLIEDAPMDRSRPGKARQRRPGKVKLAVRLRAEMVVIVKWIATRLSMGTVGYVNNRLYRWRQGRLK